MSSAIGITRYPVLEGADRINGAESAGNSKYWGTSPTGVEGFWEIIPTWPWVNAKSNNIINLVGDGTTDDGPAINTLIAGLPAGSTIYFPKFTYKISTSVLVTKEINFIGAYPTFSTSANIRIFDVSAERARFGMLNFVGAGSQANQTGIIFSTAGYGVVHDCRFDNLFLCGIAATSTHVSGNLGGKISNCAFYNNGTGMYFTTRGEYFEVSNCNGEGNGVGIRVLGGNVIFSACNFNYNTTGIYFSTGTNNGHGIVTGCQFNHCTTYGVRVEDITPGQDFIGCHIYQSNILVKNSTCVRFLSCSVDCDAYYFENSTNTRFETCSIGAGQPNVVNDNYNSTTSVTVWKNCHEISQTSKIKTGAYSWKRYDKTIYCNGTFTVSLLAFSSISEHEIEIINIGTGTITIAPNGTDQIDGVNTSKTLTTQYSALRLRVVEGKAYSL